MNILTHCDHLETYLQDYQTVIGADYEGYRGHLYRVLNYILHFLGPHTPQRDLIAFVLVHHDIGLWTDKELAYLEPSIQQALKVNKSRHLGFNDSLVRDMIFYHHKVTPYKGPHAELVNVFRKADWIDASQGKIRKGIARPYIDAVMREIPANGFYETLSRLGPELTDNQRLKMIGKFLKVFKW